MALKTFIDSATANKAAAVTSLHNLAVTEGVHNKARGDFQVTGTAGRAVNIAIGEAFVENEAHTVGSYIQQFYPVFSDSIVNLSINENTSGSTRIDIVALKIDTGATPGAEGSGAVSIVAIEGTPGAGTPALPDRHLSLSELNLSSGFTTIGASDITDTRVQAQVNEITSMVRATQISAQSIPNSTFTTITGYNDSTGDNYDLGNDFNASTGVFTAPVDGYYSFSCQAGVSSGDASQVWVAQLTKNGSTELRFIRSYVRSTGPGDLEVIVTADNERLNTGDTVTLQVLSGASGNVNTDRCIFNGRLLQKI